MAIKSDVSFKGITVNDSYIKLEKIVNAGPNIQLQVGIYSIVDGEKGELIERLPYEIENTKSILDQAYQALKTQIFTESTDI